MKIRAEVKEFLSSILDKVEKKQGITIRRPPEYENIKEKSRRKADEGAIVGTLVTKLVASEEKYGDRRNMARKLVCDIVQSAAKQKGVTIKFPPNYKPYTKQPESSCERRLNKETLDIVSRNDTSRNYATAHAAVLRDISLGKILLKSTTEEESYPERTISPEKETEGKVEFHLSINSLVNSLTCHRS